MALFLFVPNSIISDLSLRATSMSKSREATKQPWRANVLMLYYRWTLLLPRFFLICLEWIFGFCYSIY